MPFTVAGNEYFQYQVYKCCMLLLLFPSKYKYIQLTPWVLQNKSSGAYIVSLRVQWKQHWASSNPFNIQNTYWHII